MMIWRIIGIGSLILNLVISWVLLDSFNLNRQMMERHTRDVMESNFQLAEQLIRFNERAEVRNAAKILSIKNQFGHNQLLIFEQLEKQREALANLRTTLHAKDVETLIVTAYTPSKEETDDTPMITAAMTKVRPGTVAVSRDLFERGWTFGKKVYIEGEGIKTINDLMSDKWEKRMDILYFDKDDATQFGKRQLTVALLVI